MTELVFLKLGGSLITDKTIPYTPRIEKIDDLAEQLARVLRDSDLQIILGHGSGSFGHTAAKEYKTRDGAPHPQPLSQKEGGEYWKGFAEVWYQASALNRFVMDGLHAAGILSMAFPASASVITNQRKIKTWDLTPIRLALINGIVPVIYGDVVTDESIGGTILSTEDLFIHLAHDLHPSRILLAGLEDGVWADYPARTQLVDVINVQAFDDLKASVGASHGADVTGGMESKVRQMLNLVEEMPELTVQIFSGDGSENVAKALRGEMIGTRLTT
jgi:isopentenyl phosphate kinase